MVSTITGQSLHARRRGLIGWGLGIMALAGVTVGFWPAVPETDQLEELMANLPESMMALFGMAGVEDLFSPSGYVDSQLFALMAPLLFVIFAVGWITSSTAGEEHDGRLELLLANPVPRRQVVLEKATAVGLGVLGLASLQFLVLAGTGALVDLGLGVGGLLVASVSLVLLTAVYAALALAVACATGRRGLAVGATAAAAVVTYLVDSFAPLVDWVDRVRAVSPFYLYRGNRPLEAGLDPLHAIALVVVTAVLVAGAVWAFERRDLGT